MTLEWCDVIDLRLEAAVSPGRPLRWGPLPPGEENDSRLNYGRVWGPWDVPPGDPDQVGLWTNITEQIVSLQWTGGSAASDTVFARWEAAQMRATFKDPKLIFDPTNSLSPFASRLVPNTPVRIRAGYRTPAGVQVDAARGTDFPGYLAQVDGENPVRPESDVTVEQSFVLWPRTNGDDDYERWQSGLVVGTVDADGNASAAIWTNGADGLTPGFESTPPSATPWPRNQITFARIHWDPLTELLTLERSVDGAAWELDASVSLPGRTLGDGVWQDISNDAATGGNMRHFHSEWAVDGAVTFGWGPDNVPDDPDATEFPAEVGGRVVLVPGETRRPVPSLAGPSVDLRTVFGGFVDSWSPQWAADPDERVTELTATDGTRILANFDSDALESPVGAGETAAQRITRILDHALWPDDQRAITPGGIALQSTDHAQPAWTELLLTADSDMGYVWVAPDGFVHYEPGEVIRQRLTNPTPDAYFGCNGFDVLLSAIPAFNTDGLRNVVSASNGNTTVVGADEASVFRYRSNTYQRFDLKIQSAADVNLWVQRVLFLGANPRRTVSQVLIDPMRDVRSFAYLLLPDALTVWRIDWDPPGDETNHVVSLDVTPGGWVHTVTADSWETVVTTGLLPKVEE